jgi:hypothetical protein
MKKLVLIAMLASLSACSTPNSKPSREWISVSCNGFANWDKCNEKAKTYCPNGFEIGSKEESLIEQKRIMQFACKP